MLSSELWFFGAFGCAFFVICCPRSVGFSCAFCDMLSSELWFCFVLLVVLFLCYVVLGVVGFLVLFFVICCPRSCVFFVLLVVLFL